MEHVRNYPCRHRRHKKEQRPCFKGQTIVDYILEYLNNRPEERFRKANYDQAFAITFQLYRQGLFVAVKVKKDDGNLASNLKAKFRVALRDQVKALPGF